MDRLSNLTQQALNLALVVKVPEHDTFALKSMHEGR
jgi:hypothetical protein